jgi:hypothetical protein
MKKKTAKRFLFKMAWKMAREKIFNPDYKKTKVYKSYVKALKVYDA